MSMPPPVLVLATPSWNGDYMKSTVALTRELARTHRVLYVEHPPTLTTQVRSVLHGDLETLRCTSRLRAVSFPDRHDVQILTPPPVLPMNALPPALYDRVLHWNARQIAPVIRRTLATLGMDRPVVLNALNPHYGVALADAFNESARIYYCYDELRARDWNGRHGGRMEDRYVTRVDAAVGTSSALYERLSALHDNAYFVPNGVDFDLFHRAAPSDLADIAANDVPCVGYLGSLDERLDYDLLNGLITAHPDWTFRFVGRVCVEEAHQLERHPNVTLTGPQPPDALPEAVRQMDVGLIPFRRTPFTQSIYPLKVNEYLAAGRPVVSTAFADLSDFAGVIHVAQTAGEFHHAVAAALRPAPPAEVNARIELARSNSWTHRGRLLKDIVQRHTPTARPAAVMV